MLLFGHRGSSRRCPENTRLAFETALRDGADGVECDLQLLADGCVIVLHDDTLRRTGNSPAHEAILDVSVAELTWGAVKDVDIGAGEHLITMEEHLAIISASDGGKALLELKGGDQAMVPRAVAVATAALEASLQPEQLIWISFDMPLVAAMKEQMPACPAFHVAHVHPAPRPDHPADLFGPEACIQLVDAAAAAGLTGVDFAAYPSVVTEAVFAHAATKSIKIGLWVAASLPGELDTPANIRLFQVRISEISHWCVCSNTAPAPAAEPRRGILHQRPPSARDGVVDGGEAAAACSLVTRDVAPLPQDLRGVLPGGYILV